MLLAIRLLPSQTPFPSVVTHDPFNETLPEPQTIQLLEVPPLHVLHSVEQGVHVPLLLNDPSGHVVPSDEVCGVASHLVASEESWVNPDAQDIQSPV